MRMENGYILIRPSGMTATSVIHPAFVLICLSAIVMTNGKETLRLGAFIAQEGQSDFTGFGVALDLALDTINNDSSLQYYLSYNLNDSMCQPAPTLRSFIDQIFLSSAENQIMLLGPGCSVAAEPVAEIAPNWNLVQISASASSPYLSDVATFPLFLRTVSSEGEVAVGIKAAMKEFGWSRIATITQSENLFTFTTTQIRNELSQANLRIIKEFTLNSGRDARNIVMELRNSPARIIFVNMYERNAAAVICKAFKYGLRYPTYQWMFPDWYIQRWWNASESCTIDEPDLQNFVLGSFTYSHFPVVSEEQEDVLNVGNITWRQFEAHYESNPKLLARNQNNLVGIRDSSFMFDAAWTAALAINRTASRLSSSGIALENFTYDGQYSRNISRTLYEEALKVNFFGLTGDVSFDENGDRPGRVTLLQYRRDKTTGNLIKVCCGRVINDSFVFEDGESSSTVFPGGAAEDEEFVHIVLALFIIYTVLSFLGICFAVVCLIFNLWFRNQKLVKLTSPYVNVMIIAGAVIFYITVILFGVDENVASFSTVDHLCQTKIWLVAIGFSLLFGSIFAKTWRIYYIFNVAKPNSKFAVKDIYLFAIVAVLILIDTTIMIPSTAISSAVLRREDEEMEGDNDDDLPQIIRVCSSDHSIVWLLILFGYKGCVLLGGLFLAIGTSKVKYSALNESQFIAMSVYGAVIVSIALTPIGFLLQTFPSIQYGIVGMMILLSITLILVLVFMSKVYQVYIDPNGEHSLHATDSIPKRTNVAYSDDENKKKIESLNLEINDLNVELKKLKNGSCMLKSTSHLITSEDMIEMDEILSKDKTA